MKQKLFLFFFFISFLNAQFIREPIFNEVSYVKTFGNPNNEAIIFVHGLGDEASTIWHKTINDLKDKYFIMIFDLPGFGKSDKSNQLYSPSKYVNFINTLVDNFVDKPFHLVGHSMGASISLLYTYLYESQVKSLTLIDAAAILDRNTYSEFLLKYKVKDIFNSNSISSFISKLPKELNGFMSVDLNSILYSRKARKLILRSNPNTIAALALVQENFSGIPERLNVPTLIIWGKKDKIAPLRTGYVLNKLIKNSELEIINNSGHVPIVDSYDKYLGLLKLHLKSPKRYKKKLIKYPQNGIVKIVKNKRNKKIEGSFKKLIIENSKNININNSKIEQLVLINSSVKILNSKLKLRKKSSITNSTLEITSSSLDISEPIKTNDSSLDFAGVDIFSSTKLFVNNEFNKKIVYSLCKINGKNIHGTFNMEVQ